MEKPRLPQKNEKHRSAAEMPSAVSREILEELFGLPSSTRYPAIRKAFRLGPLVPDDTLRQVFHNIAAPQEVPVQELAREHEGHEPLTEERLKEVVTASHAAVQTYWHSAFQKEQLSYGKDVGLRLFKGSVKHAVGPDSNENMGPLYHPVDDTVFFPYSFADKLNSSIFAASDQIVVAYIVAHEMAHAVQQRLGFLPKIQDLQRKTHLSRITRLSRVTELHADYLAGCSMRDIHDRFPFLQDGDTKKIYWALAAIGDDVQMAKYGRPITFAHMTHGTARDRALAFWEGFSLGDWRVSLPLISKVLKM